MKNYFLTRLFYFFVILSMLLSAVGTPMQTVLAAPENAALQLDGTNDHTLFSLNLDASNFTPETLVNHTSEGATMSTGTSGFDGKGGRPSRIYPDLAKGMDLGDGKTLANVNMMWSLGNTSTGVISANFEEAVSGGNHTAWGLSANDNYRTGFMTTQASTPTPAAVSGLLGHWRFDESSWVGDCSTADILDSSGNNRHGTACIDGDAPFPVPGKFGNAGRFDGIDQYANMGPGFNFTSSFTAAMWIALDDYDWCGPTGKSQHIIGTHDLATPTGNGRGWGIYWDCDGLAWELTNSTGSAIGSYGYVQPSPFPANGSWHHIALAYDSSVPSATLYWDGAPIYSESGIAKVPSFLFNNGEPLTINGLPYAPSSGASGKIDDTRAYNRVLSAAEIQTLFGNQPPVAVEDAYSTDQNTVLIIAAPGVLGNDSDPNGDAITAFKVSDPANGTLSLNANGSFTYTPNADFSGSDTFTYKASDVSLPSNVASVSIQVNAVPSPRVFSVLRANSSPTSASSVDFTVTFSEPVSGVDVNDFILSTVGVIGATITVVSGTGAMRTVTVNTGSGNGTIRLYVPISASVMDLSGNPLADLPFTSGEEYSIVKNSTFSDVPFDHMFWEEIEALYEAGLTTGCSQTPLKFCPLNNVTRGEMAVFLERAMGNFNPTPNPTDMFTDVPDPDQPAAFQAFIEEFYNGGIATGCSTNPLKYCPQNYVTRGEMAVFIERALGNFAPTPSQTGMFADIPNPNQPAAFQAFIEQFYLDRITTGCAVNPLRYCPMDKVTRQEMAVFIVRAFGIPLP